MEFEIAFFLAGVILILGFLGDYFFRRFSLPDVLILIALGFFIGPVFNIIDASALAGIAPLFATLALIIILFDAGLNLKLLNTLHNSPRAMVLAFLGVGLSMAATMAFAYIFLGWDIVYGLLLGTIVGGTSSSIVIPMISRTKVHGKISSVLSLESVFTDAITVVVGIALLQLIQSTPTGNEFSLIASGVVGQFSVGAMAGTLAGLIWLKVMNYIRGQLDDILTLAFVFIMFAIVQFLGGNGAIFALVFGLVLGNGREIAGILNTKPVEASLIMKKFQNQISFFIRTFFFVYIGLILSVGNLALLAYGIGITVLLLGARYLAVRISSFKDDMMKDHVKIMTTMMPRGLAAAILAQVVSTSGIPNASLYSDLVITVIIASVVIASAGSFVFRNNKQREEKKKNGEKNSK